LIKPNKPLFTLGLFLTFFLLSGCDYVVLDPKGPVAEEQKNLILYSIIFMIFIILVVYALFFIIVVKYRERKDKLDYEPPQKEGSKLLETIWTIIPIIIVIALSIPTVKAIYTIEKPKDESQEPLVINATSVDWKWVFSYPEQNIETVNYIKIPAGRPVLFKLTSADSMASFWVPALGGQKYAMAGMENKLYLEAHEPGVFDGRNANFTGEGFAHQTFKVTAQTKEDFEKWVNESKQTAPPLTQDQYDQLMLQGPADVMTFSSTHLQWVDHAREQDYALRVREKLGQLPKGTVDRKKNEDIPLSYMGSYKSEQSGHEYQSHSGSH